MCLFVRYNHSVLIRRGLIGNCSAIFAPLRQLFRFGLGEEGKGWFGSIKLEIPWIGCTTRLYWRRWSI